MLAIIQALSIGAELMLKLRTEVKERLGYTTSAGIARNKVLAKVCISRLFYVLESRTKSYDKLVASYKKLDQQVRFWFLLIIDF